MNASNNDERPPPAQVNASNPPPVPNSMNKPMNGQERVATAIDDLQFNASLDVLLANVDSTDSASMMGSVHNGANPSVVSYSSSSTSNQNQRQQLKHAPGAPMQVATGQALPSHNGGALETQAAAGANRPQQPQVVATTLFPTLPKTSTGEPLVGPSALTARLSAMTSYPGIPGAPLPVAIPSTATTRPMTNQRTTPRETKSRKRSRSALAVSEEESCHDKRRIDRNVREQQRSHQITKQISVLKELLTASNVNFKPDKYSTLVSVVDYIKQLQARSALLDAEHKKLLDTITKTNEMIDSNYYQTNADGDTMPLTSDLMSDESQVTSEIQDEYGVFVQGLDYKGVFAHCGIALAVASIDGRFIDCNREFEEVTGYARNELLPNDPQDKKPEQVPEAVSSYDDVASGLEDTTTAPSTASAPSATTAEPAMNLSLFNLLGREDMEQVFAAMSVMLKEHPVEPGSDVPAGADQALPNDIWSGRIAQSRRPDITLTINITLVRTPKGRPKFFNCALTPAAT